MGKKYASIHVFGDGVGEEKVILAMKNNCIDDLEESIWKMIRQKYKDNIPEKFQKLLKYNEFSKITIIKSDDIISIYDESYSFETIQDKVKNLSFIIDYPILYTSNFDDGVFLIGVYKDGKLITSGKMGSELSEYGLKSKKINIDKLCNTIRLKREEALGSINSMEEIDIIETVIEEYLHIPLDLDIDYVESNKTYMETFSNDKFRIYKKAGNQ